MIDGYRQQVLSSLPRVRIDLRDIHRLDRGDDYHLDVIDDAGFKTKHVKLFFFPSSEAFVNNNIHRSLVLSDAVVVLAQEGYRCDLSYIDAIRSNDKSSCAVVVLIGDYFIQPKAKHVDFPHTSPAPAAAFLLGQLTAILSPRQVVVLHEDGPYFKCPTDYYAASYIPLDADERWKELLSDHLMMLGVRMNKNISIDTFFGTTRN